MKFVKLTCEKREETYWVNVAQIVVVSDGETGGSYVDVIGSTRYCYNDDRTPEALVAAIEEATK